MCFPIISERRSRENQNDLILRRAKDIFKGEALLKRRLLANSLRNNSHNFLFLQKVGNYVSGFVMVIPTLHTGFFCMAYCSGQGFLLFFIICEIIHLILTFLKNIMYILYKKLYIKYKSPTSKKATSLQICFQRL